MPRPVPFLSNALSISSVSNGYDKQDTLPKVSDGITIAMRLAMAKLGLSLWTNLNALNVSHEVRTALANCAHWLCGSLVVPWV